MRYQLELVDLLAITPATVLVKKTKDVCDGWQFLLLGSICISWKTVEYFVEETNKAYTDLQNEINELEDNLDALRAWSTLLSDTLATWDTNISIATDEYLRTSSKMARNILETGTIGDDLIEWIDCYSSAYAGVPTVLSEQGCKVNFVWRRGYNPYSAGLKTLEDFSHQYSDLTVFLFNPSFYIGRETLDELGKRVIDFIALHAAALVYVLDYDEIFKHGALVFKPNVSDADLETAYQFDGVYQSGGRKNLIKIVDIVNRIQADMHLDSNSHFDPEEFRVVRNAVVLSKLSLLGPNELNRLVASAGVGNLKKYPGPLLFASGFPFNILYDAIGNIDGGFAWMGVAPYFPRSAFNDDTSTDQERLFGYSSSNGIDGFKLWEEPEAREKVFLKIFKGPIATGIEFPSNLGQPELLPTYYQERVCAGNPFPINTSKQRCGPTAGWLVPIISQLLQ